MKNIINELSWRGLIQDKVSGLENRLKKPITMYVGLDPTSNSIHIGNLIAIIMMIHFQKNGHKTIVLIGGATGLIGDPSERDEEKIILNENILKKNIKSISNQIYKLFSYHSLNIELLNNIDWIKNVSFLDFIRKIGKYFSINYLMSKDSIKKRIKNGISFNEFSYSIVQSYDYLYLNKLKNCQLQTGGSDQWGNITSGIELIKKKTGQKVYGFTFPLITKSNGIKFGKSNTEENVWLDDKKTSPYQFYQFWINVSDTEVEKYIKMYSFLSKKEINQLILQHRENPNKRLLQKRLASEITAWIHGDEKKQEIEKIVFLLFNKNYKDFQYLNEKEFASIYKNIPHAFLKKNENLFLLELLKKVGFLSMNKAIRALNNRSIYINKIIVEKNFLIQEKHLIGKKYILLQFGKKNFFIVKFK